MKYFTLSDSKIEIRHYRRRIIIISLLMLILVGLLMGRLAYLQIVEYRYYLAQSEQNLLSAAPIDPSRGLIYDRNNILLAGDIPVFSLEISTDNKNNVKKINALSHIVDLTQADIDSFYKQWSLDRRFNSVPLKVKLSDEDMAAFSVNQYRFPGIFVQAHLVRYYPFGPLLEPVLGYVGRITAQEFSHVDSTNYSASNFIGKEGIEKYDEAALHGVVGIKKIETSADGQVVNSHQSRPPISGETLYLTIDSRLQAAAQQALGDMPGAVVALDPRNGQVLALVSNPSFDPNLFVTGMSTKAYQLLQHDSSKPLYNRALQGEFPSGSTVKPYYAVGALANGVISPGYRLFDPGFFKLPGRPHIYHNWKRSGFGWVDVESAIIQSCDTFFFDLAIKLGISRIDTILHNFGFGELTHIDTNTELKGLVPSPEWKKQVHHIIWYPGDTVSMGVGQGYFLVTPIQLATALMRLVDYGGGYVPQLILKTENAKGIIKTMQPKLITPVINYPKKDFELVLQAMREVVSNPHGTAYQAGHTAKYTYGGKSGTVQVFSLKAGQSDKAHLLPKKLRDDSWFEAFAPAHNPSIVLVVFLENGGEGKASFTTRQILDSYFSNERI